MRGAFAAHALTTTRIGAGALADSRTSNQSLFRRVGPRRCVPPAAQTDTGPGRYVDGLGGGLIDPDDPFVRRRQIAHGGGGAVGTA
jgi:hypothetical protein